MRSAIGRFLGAPSLALCAALLAAGCDGGGTADRGKADGSQAALPASGSGKPAGVSVGEIDRSNAGRPVPDVSFAARGGKPVRLADFAGQPVLVNLWATWCAPCVAEMPALDRLAGKEGAPLVLPVSQDIGGWEEVEEFFTPGKFDRLEPYLDQPNELALALGARGLPMTVLYDAEGREVWRVNGPLEWDSPEIAGRIARDLAS